jgi:hypothetical protein
MLHVSKLIHVHLLEQGLTHVVHINANGLASRSDLLRRNEHIETSTAAIIDNHLALMRRHKECSSMSDGIVQVFEAHLFQIRQSKGMAAAKAKVGAVWYGLQFFLRIPKGSRDVCMRLGFISTVGGFDCEASVSFVYSCRDIGCCRIFVSVHGLTDDVVIEG